MWRRRSSLRLTLHQSLCSSSSKLPNSHLHSSFFSASSSSSSSSAPNSLDRGFPKPDVAPPFSASVNISSLASTTRHYARCYWELSKARLSMLVVATSGTGFVLGSGSAVDFAGLCWTCAGPMMVAASASSLNQVFEIKNDAKMKRTRLRPLPSERITIPHAVTWASTVGLAGTALLASKANMLAAGLAASNLILYAFIYTPMKQIHPVNAWVGAVIGAIPPLLGMLVVATSGTGFVLGSGSAVDFAGLCQTCAGTMMVAASASSLNQVFEIKNDAKMKRTRLRPLPSERITIIHAVTWASTVGLAGTALLASKANMLAAGLAASNPILYAFVYTPMKQIHPVNTWVGAVVGAIPPLLGWAAASGQVSLNGMILPAALYFWQIPHFMALAYMWRDDYAAGGFKMYSLADASGQRTALVALRNSLYLIPLGYLAYDWGVTSGWFCLESSVLTLAISAAAFSFYRDRTAQKARRMFHASLLYLPVFMTGLLVHRLPDNEQCIEEDNTAEILSFLETKDEESKNLNENEVMQSRVRKQARPPVAYASVAPFPFLPAPYTFP